MKLVRFFPVVLAAVVAVVPVDAQPAEDTTARILDAWKKRREAFKSVRYVVTGKVEVFFLDVPIPDFKNKLPKMPVEYPYRAEVLLDIPTGRFSFVGRRSVLSIGDGGFVEASAVTRFDGERTMIGAPPGGVVPRGVNDVMIQTGNLSREVFTAELWPLFHAHGITPTARKPISPKRLKQAASEEAFEYRGQMVHDGVHVSVLRTELQDAVPVLSDELFVDQKRDAAVVRHTYFTGKRPMARIDISWKQQGVAWLPAEWTCTWSSDGKVQSKNHLRVAQVELDPAVKDDDFRYAIGPKMSVVEYDSPEPGSGLDPSKPSMRKYVADERGKLTLLEETGKTTLAGERLPPESRFKWIWWVVGAVLLTTAALIVVLRRSRRERR